MIYDNYKKNILILTIMAIRLKILTAEEKKEQVSS
jgi:hypothetical protein